MSTNVVKETEMEAQRNSVDRLLSIESAAAILSHSPWTVRKWIAEGKIRSNKIGARRLVPMSEVNRLINESAIPAGSMDNRK
jgi:excisionase family DNA binding protein